MSSFTRESFNRDRQTGSWLGPELMDVVALPPQLRMALARVDMGEVGLKKKEKHSKTKSSLSSKWGTQESNPLENLYMEQSENILPVGLSLPPPPVDFPSLPELCASSYGMILWSPWLHMRDWPLYSY